MIGLCTSEWSGQDRQYFQTGKTSLVLQFRDIDRDRFHPDSQSYWDDQFNSFFSADTGIDIDYLWIDMNEAANFCNAPCLDPFGYAEENDFPPEPPPVRNSSPIALPGFPPDFQPPTNAARLKRQDMAVGSKMGLPGRNVTYPPYEIQNAAGSLSNKTINTDLVHYNGLIEYDTHNLYGTMMSNHSVNAMHSRRPGERTLVITRSTFLGAGKYVAHWLGDNLSNWHLYRTSIAQMLAFNSIFQIPMVGSDICGFGGNTTERLCGRWMMLGAFYPFMRNHNELGAISQEAYRWESVAAAARYAIDIRYRMLDYFYTAFYEQTVDGTPSLNPMFYIYPNDSNTFGIDTQFFWGNAVLISPVLEENSTSVDIYLPDDIFYDWNNDFAAVRGNGETVSLNDIDFQTIPIHIRGGTILPLRMESANTTTELRKVPMQLVVAPGLNGTATGSLYIDDGLSLEQASTTYVNFAWNGSVLSVRGTYEYAAGVNISNINMLGINSEPQSVTYNGNELPTSFNATTKILDITSDLPLTQDADILISFSEIQTYQGRSNQLAVSFWGVALSSTVVAAVALLL